MEIPQKNPNLLSPVHPEIKGIPGKLLGNVRPPASQNRPPTGSPLSESQALHLLIGFSWLRVWDAIYIDYYIYSNMVLICQAILIDKWLSAC